MEGSIEVIIGCMFSSKTTDLMQHAKRAVIAGQKICFIIHERDDRYSRQALNTSHDGLSMNVIRVASLEQDPPETLNCGSIFVDEGHWFVGLKDFCLRHKRLGRHVKVAGLTSDFHGAPWPEIQGLVPAHADKVTLKHGVCAFCQKDALYTRKVAGDMSQVIDVGGDDKYISTCLLHLTEPPTVDQSVLRSRRAAVQNVKILIGTTATAETVPVSST